MKEKSKNRDFVGVKGFARLQIIDQKSKKIVGDSGWFENQITNYGMNSCIVAGPIGAASVQAAQLMLGSGSDPASDAVALPDSLTKFFTAFAQSSVIDSLTARMTASMSGTDAVTLSNIGVFNAYSDTLLAGKTFASSAMATTQSVNCSYEWRYSI